MNFETVERCGRTHVVINGVESAAFVERLRGNWYLYDFVVAATLSSADEGIARIANAMGDWYTVKEAARALVEMGIFDEPPSKQMMGIWLRKGLFPGAMKVPKRGSGGSWRIPASALPIFAERRKAQ